MKNKKLWNKFLAAVVVAAMGMTVLGGCGASGTEDSSSETKEATETEGESSEGGYTVALVNYGLGNTWRTQMQAEFIQQAEEYIEQGILKEYYITNADGDAAQEVSDFEDMINKGVDAICVTAASPDGMIDVVDEAMEEGIKVINFDNCVNTDNVTATIAIDNTEFGRVCAKYMVEKLNGKGKIVVLNGTAGVTSSEERTAGMHEILDKYPEIEILGEAYADWDYAAGKSAMESFLSAYPEIDGVLSQGGAMTQGAVEAFQAAGRDLVPMTCEANNGILRIWKENLENGFSSVAPISPTNTGAMALRTAIAALQGEEYEENQIVNLDPITDETLDDYYREDMPDGYWAPCELTEEKLAELYGN